jgi:hypothetical protein
MNDEFVGVTLDVALNKKKKRDYTVALLITECVITLACLLVLFLL